MGVSVCLRDTLRAWCWAAARVLGGDEKYILDVALRVYLDEYLNGCLVVAG